VTTLRIIYEEAAALPGAPDGWMPPQQPEGWNSSITAIVAAKFVAPSTSEEKSYVRAHCSFQSTGGTNISTVNAMSELVCA
jgi:hypothetical protein